MLELSLRQQAEATLAYCRSQGIKIVTAESCTGGLIGALLTSVAGSSTVYERGFITYSNEAKVEQLGVLEAQIFQLGAVSAEVAEAMALGALQHSQADLALSVTGIAGPGGGSPEKPVGLVYLARAMRHGPVIHRRYLFEGDRDAIRNQAAEAALSLVLAKGTEG